MYTLIKSTPSTTVADATSVNTCAITTVTITVTAYFVFTLYLNVLYRINKCKDRAAP